MKIKQEFIQKVKNEKVAVLCTTEEEVITWYNFLDEHMDKSLVRPRNYIDEPIYYVNRLIANDTDFKNICEFNCNESKNMFYERGYQPFNFKDVIE